MDIDLNNEKLMNYEQGLPFFPREVGSFKLELRTAVYRDGFKGGKQLRFGVIVTESNAEAVKSGEEYCLYFPLTDADRVKQEIRQKEVRAFVAAVFGADPSDLEFDANAALETLLEVGDLPKGDFGAAMRGVAKQKENRTFINFCYSALA
jgi:hypothetical protein